MDNYDPKAKAFSGLVGWLSFNNFGLVALTIASIAICIIFFGDLIGGPMITVTARSIFEFSVESITDSKEVVALSKYAGKKAYLVVNVATK